MRADFEKLFSVLSEKEVPDGLFGRVMEKIQREQRLINLKRKMVFFAFCLVISIGIFIPVLRAVYSGFVDSGFIALFFLLFSDAGTVMTYWQNYALSLLETLPVTRLILFFATILALMELLRLAVRNVKNIFMLKGLITHTYE